MVALITMMRNVQLFTGSHSTSIKPAAGQQGGWRTEDGGEKKTENFCTLTTKKTTKYRISQLSLTFSCRCTLNWKSKGGFFNQIHLPAYHHCTVHRTFSLSSRESCQTHNLCRWCYLYCILSDASQCCDK